MHRNSRTRLIIIAAHFCARGALGLFALVIYWPSGQPALASSVLQSTCPLARPVTVGNMRELTASTDARHA